MYACKLVVLLEVVETCAVGAAVMVKPEQLEIIMARATMDEKKVTVLLIDIILVIVGMFIFLLDVLYSNHFCKIMRSMREIVLMKLRFAFIIPT